MLAKRIAILQAEKLNSVFNYYPKTTDKVILTVDCELYTCEKCDNIIMTLGDAKRLDQAIEDSLTRALR